MSKLIANSRCWVGFSQATITGEGSTLSVTAAQIGLAKDLTPYLVTLNASTQGNQVPTPSLDSLFETSISGTVQATFTGDFYKDDEDDLAWDTLARGEEGFFIVSRYGGSDVAPHINRPVAQDEVEIWPVIVTARTAGALSSNTAQTFTLTASVPIEPNESATVAA